jgi:hypothetical protein
VNPLKMNDEEMAALQNNCEAAAKAMFRTCKRYARQHGIPEWLLLINTVARLNRMVAANCDEKDEFQRLVQYLVESLAGGGEIAGYGMAVHIATTADLPRRDAPDPSTTAGLH